MSPARFVNPNWLEPLKDRISYCQSTNNDDHDVRFVCSSGEEVRWDGLAYLASLTSAIREPRCHEIVTFLTPGYEAAIVRKLLELVSKGSAVVTDGDVVEMTNLSHDLGVRKDMKKILCGTSVF